MNIQPQFIIFGIFLFYICLALTFYFIRQVKISSSLNKRFGNPIKQFYVTRAWNTLIIKNSPTIVTFYDDFFVVTYLWTGKEFIVPRTQSDIKIFYSNLYFVIEITIETKTAYKKLQLTCLKGEKEQFFLDYFKLQS